MGKYRPGMVAANARRRAQTHQSEYARTAIRLPEGAPLFQIKKAGTYRIDILPYLVPKVDGHKNPHADAGTYHFERTYWVHRNIGPNKETYICLAKTCGKPCPVCEFLDRLRRDPQTDPKLIKDMLPKERQLFNIVNLAEEDKGVQIWDISFHLFGKGLDNKIKNQDRLSKEQDGDYETFAELMDGMSIKIDAVEKSAGERGKSFFECTSMEFRRRRQNYDEAALESVYVLDECIVLPEYQQLKEILLQTGDDEPEPDEGGVDPEPPPTRRLARTVAKEEPTQEDIIPFDGPEQQEPPKRTRRVQPEPEPEPEPEPTEDVAGEPEEPPKRVTSRLGKPAQATQATRPAQKPQTATKPTTSQKCPAGGVFGKSTDELGECAKCKLWSDCDEAKYAKK